MSLTDLTEKISYVSQDNFLFNMSLRDNIRIGKPEATDKEVEWAAAQAGCDEFISRFPKGTIPMPVTPGQGFPVASASVLP